MGNVLVDNHDPTRPKRIKWPCDIAEYFNLISTHVKKYSIENTLTSTNSNAKENEQKVFVNKRRISQPANPIHWKEFILKYLLEQYDQGRQWVPELYRLIKLEVFYTEKHWLSLFFWEEFEMRTKPSCLVKKLKIRNYPQSDYFSYEVEEITKKDITSDFKIFQEKIYTYIRILKQHITNNGHPFQFIITNFARIFSKYIKEHIETLSALNKSDKEKFLSESIIVCDDITGQLNDFIYMLEEALSLMYSKTFNYHIFIEEKDEFVNLISGCIFQDSTLYKQTIALIRMSISLEIKDFGEILASQKFTTPEYLGISDKFCLNQLSLIYYRDKHQGQNIVDINKVSQPYQLTIDLLKSVAKYKKPYDKMLLIHKMSHTISDCINSFWSKVDPNLPMHSFGIEADDLLNIFDYLIIKSQMSDLLTQMKFVKLFTSTKTRSTMIGYYYSSMEVSILKINSTKERYPTSISSSSYNDCQDFIDMTSKRQEVELETKQ